MCIHTHIAVTHTHTHTHTHMYARKFATLPYSACDSVSARMRVLCGIGFKLSNSMGLKFKCKSFDDNNYGAGSLQVCV